MARESINIGEQPNDGSGDPLRNAFEKVENNFVELYNAVENPTASSAVRQNFAVTTSSLADDASENVDVTAYKGYILYKIQTTHACWIRFYTDNAARAADATRQQNEFPEDGSGVIAEFITSSPQVLRVSPGVIGFNNDAPVTNNIPMRITNLSGGGAQIQVVVTLLGLEA